MPFYEVIWRLVLAAACSGLIGFEREASQKAAGLRTHTLVGVGAAMFTIVSIVGFEGGDEGRVAAQVVTGIGFLGAGAIFRDGSTVSGLTTAAGLWAAAAIGLAAGSGSYFVALIGTVVVMTVLQALRSADAAVARRLAQPRPALRIHLTSASALNSVVKFIRKLDDDATQVDFQKGDEDECFVVIAVDSDRADMVSEMISVHKGVDKVEKLNVLYRPPGGTSPGHRS